MIYVVDGAGMTRFVCGLVLVLAGTAAAQERDTAQPPPLVRSAGRFSARALSQRPVIDGREWVAADVQPASVNGAVPLRTRTPFSLTLTGCGDRGDFTRCQLLLRRGGGAAVRVDAGFTGWVFVTPDARYVVTEPLYVLDVRDWTQYDVGEALQIRNYTQIEAISRDGKRLVVSRRGCAMDCGDMPKEYYELTLPQ